MGRDYVYLGVVSLCMFVMTACLGYGGSDEEGNASLVWMSEDSRVIKEKE